MIAIIAASSIAWDIQSPYAAETKIKYKVEVKAHADGEEHTANFTLFVQSHKKTGESIPVNVGWSELMVDGNEIPLPTEWKGTIDAAGNLLTVEDGDEYRRMLNPFLFAFPNKSVAEKDKWESTWLKADHPAAPKFSAEAVGVEKVGEADALKIMAKFVEKGDKPMSSEGTWWVGAKGIPVKFTLKVHNWIVPMADANEAIEADVTGTLIP